MDLSPESKKLEAVPAEPAACLDNLVCQKILAESSGSMVRIEADSETGTGWVGPDGRVLTDWHVVAGRRSVNALAADGKVYKLGKDIAIDDAHDIAALGFVDKAPAAKGLSFPDKIPSPGDGALMLSHPHGLSLHLSIGSFRHGVNLGKQFEESAGGKQRLESYLSKYPVGIRGDAAEYYRRSIDVYALGGAPGSSGGAIFDSEGKVEGLLEMGNPSKSGEIGALPIRYADALLKQTPEQRKFDITTGYETGAGYFVRRTIGEDNLHRAVHLGIPAAGIYGLSKFAVSQTSGKLATLAGLGYLAYDSYSNYDELKRSTSWRDTLHGALASSGDFLIGAGLASKFVKTAGTIGTAALGLGVALRAGAELVPNHYAIKEIKRKDGASDTNLWEFMMSRAKE